MHDGDMVVRDTGSFYRADGNLTEIDWIAVNNRSLLEAALNSEYVICMLGKNETW